MESTEDVAHAETLFKGGWGGQNGWGIKQMGSLQSWLTPRQAAIECTPNADDSNSAELGLLCDGKLKTGSVGNVSKPVLFGTTQNAVYGQLYAAQQLGHSIEPCT
ncbi:MULTISPECIES: hypothetical protein [Paenibacillus]|uniref:hypothetical protein n=1 Tax=Paenibacillus TaxID=44249 RepID=UPI0022B9340A|nr:hypothetical protein [Paenibacillus caseinilyticus]MCZ8518398.1 hypothetical protein [Paenibacillus caseinilyticus]